MRRVVGKMSRQGPEPHPASRAPGGAEVLCDAQTALRLLHLIHHRGRREGRGREVPGVVRPGQLGWSLLPLTLRGPLQLSKLLPLGGETAGDAST